MKRVEDTNKSFEKELNYSKKILIASGVIFGICIGIAISFYSQGLRFQNLFAKNILDVGTSGGYSISELKAMWQIFGLSGMVGTLSLLIGGLQFYLLGYGNLKRMRTLKKTRDKALEKLEEVKKENMLMGTYDASK